MNIWRNSFAATLALAVIGCGGSSSKQPSPADGGSQDFTVSDLHAGNDLLTGKPDLQSGISANDACTQDANAFCTRLQACNPRSYTSNYVSGADCVSRRKQACLNALSAPSTSATPTKTAACATAISAQTCDDYNNGNTPTDCLPLAGGLTDGTPCNYAAQCQSTFCATPADTACGACAALVSAGGACVNGDCPTGLYCSKLTTTCVTRVTQPGMPCENGEACGFRLSCVGAKPKMGVKGVCTQDITTPNAPCEQPSASPTPSQATCDPTTSLFCVGDKAKDKVCVPTTFVQPTPVPSPACGSMSGTSYGICAAGAQCQFTSGQVGYCSGPALDGKSCDTTVNDNCLAPAKCLGTQVDGGIINGTCTFPGPPYCH